MIQKTDNSFRRIPKTWSEGRNVADNPYFTWDILFSKEECDNIIKLSELFKKEKGTVSYEGKPIADDQYRKNITVQWMRYTEDTAWIYDKIWNAVSSIQIDGWNFDIRGIFEDIQYTEYDASKGQAFYNAHKDTGEPYGHRKISVTLLLSDPNEFSGGRLVIEDEDDTVDLSNKGAMVMFPSFLKHQVEPVTKGKRKVLVAWISGPKLK